MTFHKLPEMKCLACEETINHASDEQDGTRPNKDDFTICLYCRNIMAFNEDLTLRPLTAKEAKEAESDQAVMEIMGMCELYAILNNKAVRH